MGVKGLWQLIDPAGKPIPLERLENRVLAIDVSIWLNQSLAGFRDASGGGGGGVVSQAHLLGLFHRVCKLLFYRIKPVFVFDGKPPQLKKDMLAKRRMRKAGAGKKADKTRNKIVENYLKQQIVAKQLHRQTQQVSKALEGGQAGLANLLSHRKGNTAAEKDLFELPAPLKHDEDDFSDEEERDDVLGRLDIDHSTDIHAVDLGSSDFKTLSSSQKYEVLLELREKRKQSSWAKLGEMPQEARSFSGYQMERLRKRRKIQKMTDEVGTELTDDSLAIADSKLFVGDREGMRKERKRIVGKDFVYMEGIRDKNLTDYEQTLADSLESEDGVTQEELLALATKEKETALDLVEPSTSFQSSSRRGGVKLLEDDSDIEDEPRPSTSGLRADTGKSETLKEVQIDMNVVTKTAFNEKDDIFADVFLPKSAVGRSASSTNSSSASEFRSSDDGSVEEDGRGKEKDLFADVFSNEADLYKLDKIMKEGEAVGEKDKNADRNRVLGAAAAAESIEEMFASVSRKTRKFEDSGEPDESKTRAAKRPKTQECVIASTMKGSSHLFLKIKSKWVEDREGPSEGKEDTNKKEEQSHMAEGDDEADDISRLLERENKALVSEMRRKQGEERLLKIKESVSKASSPKVKAKSGTIGTSQGAEEMKILKSMNIEARSVEAYTKSIIGTGEDPKTEQRADAEVPLEKAREEEGNIEQEDPVVYGSSAPGFVRGSRSSNIVEVDKNESSTGDAAPLDQSILIKLDNTEDDADVLTESELRAIQERLARDTSALIAERGKHERIAATVSDQMYADCQELLQMFGIPWVVAPSEAEAQCAFFDLIGMTDGSVTDDSDVWLFGGQSVLKNFFNQDKHCENFTAAEIGRHIGLSREKMVLLALLTGSDYTEGITDVGPVTAMEILAEFPGTGVQPLNEFKRWWKDQQTLSGKLPVGSKTREKFRKFQLPESFPNQKIIDAYLYPTVDNSTEGFSWAVPNFVELRDFAQERFGWTRQKVDELIKPVIKRFDTKATQSKIDKFFSSDRLTLPSKGLIQSSKRVQEAVEKVLGKETKSDVNSSEGKRGPKSNQRKVPKTESQEASRKRPILTPKEAEEKRKAEAKAKAAQVWKKTRSDGGVAKSRKGSAKKKPVRKVMSQHNLSESDSD